MNFTPNPTVKKTLGCLGKVLLWFTWLYPFLRVFVVLPVAFLEDHGYTAEKEKGLLEFAKYFHGGALMTEFISGIYMLYFFASVLLYIFWRYRQHHRIGWVERIAMPLVTLYNIFNVYLMYLVENDRTIQ